MSHIYFSISRFPRCVSKLSVLNMCWDWPGKSVSAHFNSFRPESPTCSLKAPPTLTADAGHSCSPARWEDDGRHLLPRSGFEYSPQGELARMKCALPRSYS